MPPGDGISGLYELKMSLSSLVGTEFFILPEIIIVSHWNYDCFSRDNPTTGRG
jgi:hypothetical protein